MARVPITVAGHTFPTQKALRVHVIAMRSCYAIGTTLAPEHATFMVALLTRHPKAQEKIGPGIKAVMVGANSYGDAEFQFVRIDGRMVNAAVDKCISAPPSPLSLFHEACRHAVADQIIAYKVEHLSPGAASRDWHAHHVDPTFATLVHDFIAARGLDIRTVRYRDGDGTPFSEGVHFADAALRDDWWQYHAEHARLELVPVREHVERHGRGRAIRAGTTGRAVVGR